MELNQKQIEYLFTFVEEKGVKYYDVQHEIVDHLATSIESEMMSNENTSFEHALHIIYSKFPITGFAQYTVDLEDSLQKFWFRKIFNTVTMGYGIPLIAFLILFTYSLYFTIISNGILALNILYYGVPVLGLYALFTFGRQFGKSCVEMMSYYGPIISHDDLTDRLLYYKVLKLVTLTMLFIPLFLSRITNFIIQDNGISISTDVSYSAIALSFFSAISIYWSLAIILYFPKMIKEVIASKYNHVVIA